MHDAVDVTRAKKSFSVRRSASPHISTSQRAFRPDTDLIYDPEDKLATPKYHSQKFSRYVGALARWVRAISPSPLEGIRRYELNGVSIDEQDIDPFALLRLLRRASVASWTRPYPSS